MKHHEHATSILALVEDLKEMKGYKDLLKSELIEIAIKICYLKTLDDIDDRLIDIDSALCSIDSTISFSDKTC
jgi:hypothetical protein